MTVYGPRLYFGPLDTPDSTDNDSSCSGGIIEEPPTEKEHRMITARFKMGVHSGRSVDTIVRRWYGRTAYVRWNVDPNRPIMGEVVKPVDGRKYYQSNAVLVLDTLIGIDEEGQ